MAYSNRHELLSYFKTGNFYTEKSVDLVIRTSGEIRLSDYMLEHMKNAKICFVKCFWPDFGRAFFVEVWKWQFYKLCEKRRNMLE